MFQLCDLKGDSLRSERKSSVPSDTVHATKLKEWALVQCNLGSQAPQQISGDNDIFMLSHVIHEALLGASGPKQFLCQTEMFRNPINFASNLTFPWTSAVRETLGGLGHALQDSL